MSVAVFGTWDSVHIVPTTTTTTPKQEEQINHFKSSKQQKFSPHCGTSLNSNLHVGYYLQTLI